MTDLNVVIKKVYDNEAALTNAIYMNLKNKGYDPKNTYFLEVGDKTHRIIHDGSLDHQTLLMNSIQRRENDRGSINIFSFQNQIKTQEEIDRLHSQVSIISVQIKRIFSSSSDVNDNFYAKPEIDREDVTKQIEEQLRRIGYLRNSQSYLIGLDIGCDKIHCQVRTVNAIYQRYKFYKTAGRTKIDVVNHAEKHLTIRDQKLFKFKDIQDMGVGGLSSQFEEMFRRAFASRTLDPFEAKELGIEHIRGIMLYGPPGCGKTLIARQISRSMNSVEPIIVNGPELMSKYVGETEENIRNVFKPAEAEYALNRELSQLHVIIFDEIDSICTHRGSNSGSTGVGDRIVNQLLTKLDGVNELNNIMVIGLTNRIDLIDKALLRPGRFEVQIEIGLPDKEGRLEILNIHTEKLRKNQCLDQEIKLDEIADLTANYTGAELKGLINSARSYALCRAIDAKDQHDRFSGKEEDNDNSQTTSFFGFRKKKPEIKSPDPEPEKTKIMVTYADMMLAMREVTPAFGQDQIITGIETGLSSHGILNFYPDFHDEYLSILDRIKRFDSSKSNVALVTLAGSKGSGKTTIALDIAKKTGYPMVRFVDQSKFVGLIESALCSKLNAEFEEFSNSSQGVIIIDDLERLIGFTNAARMRDTVLSSLLTMIDKLEKLGADRKYVVIFTGTRDVIQHITDPRMNLVDPRSVKGRIELPELPLLVKDDPVEKINKYGFESYDAYMDVMRKIQNKIAANVGMNCMRFSHYDLFSSHHNHSDIDELPYDSIPIKYYIDTYNDALIRLSTVIEDNSEQ